MGQEYHQAASVACVIEEEVSDEAMPDKDVEALPLYNVRQETVDDVIVNPQLSAEQRNQVKDLLIERNTLYRNRSFLRCSKGDSSD